MRPPERQIFRAVLILTPVRSRTDEKPVNPNATKIYNFIVAKFASSKRDITQTNSLRLTTLRYNNREFDVKVNSIFISLKVDVNLHHQKQTRS